MPKLRLVPGSVTVSGVSSGGYMATQLQVAHARDVAGAGIVAAGPWFCAEGLVARTLSDCLAGDAADGQRLRTVFSEEPVSRCQQRLTGAVIVSIHLKSRLLEPCSGCLEVPPGSSLIDRTWEHGFEANG